MKQLVVVVLVLLFSPLSGSALSIRIPGDQPTIQAGIDRRS